MAEFPEWGYDLWKQQLVTGHDYYVRNTLPPLERRFGAE